MSDTNQSKPSGDRAEQLARTSRWAAVVGAGGLIVFVLSLGFGSYYLSQIADEVERARDSVEVLQDTLDQLDAVIVSRRKRIDQLRREEDSLQARIGEMEGTPQATERRPTAWIQVGGKEQRIRAQKMGDVLAQERFGSFRVPGIETVESLPQNNQIRVFHPSDMERAKKVRDSLAEEGFVFNVRDLSGHYEADPGIFEFWFSASE